MESHSGRLSCTKVSGQCVQCGSEINTKKINFCFSGLDARSERFFGPEPRRRKATRPYDRSSSWKPPQTTNVEALAAISSTFSSVTRSPLRSVPTLHRDPHSAEQINSRNGSSPGLLRQSGAADLPEVTAALWFVQRRWSFRSERCAHGFHPHRQMPFPQSRREACSWDHLLRSLLPFPP
jgi:hypothetical protein